MTNTFPFATVMLIDDNRIDNLLNRKIIEKEKIAENTLVFDNAQEALAYLQRLDPAHPSGNDLVPKLIFVDIFMPEMGGLAFLREFTRLPHWAATCRLVFISGSLIDQSTRDECIRYLPNVVFISKPLTRLSLEKAIG